MYHIFKVSADRALLIEPLVQRNFLTLFKEFPSLEKVQVKYAPELSAEDQSKKDLRFIIEDCAKRADSAKKMKQELDKKKKRDQEEAEKMQRLKDEEDRKKQAIRERRKQRQSGESGKAVLATASDRSDQPKKLEFQFKTDSGEEESADDDLKEVSATKPRKLLDNFTEVTLAEVEEEPDEDLDEVRDFDLSSSKKKVHWGEQRARSTKVGPAENKPSQNKIQKSSKIVAQKSSSRTFGGSKKRQNLSIPALDLGDSPAFSDISDSVSKESPDFDIPQKKEFDFVAKTKKGKSEERGLSISSKRRASAPAHPTAHEPKGHDKLSRRKSTSEVETKVKIKRRATSSHSNRGSQWGANDVKSSLVFNDDQKDQSKVTGKSRSERSAPVASKRRSSSMSRSNAPSGRNENGKAPRRKSVSDGGKPSQRRSSRDDSNTITDPLNTKHRSSEEVHKPKNRKHNSDLDLTQRAHDDKQRKVLKKTATVDKNSTKAESHRSRKLSNGAAGPVTKQVEGDHSKKPRSKSSKAKTVQGAAPTSKPSGKRSRQSLGMASSEGGPKQRRRKNTQSSATTKQTAKSFGQDQDFSFL